MPQKPPKPGYAPVCCGSSIVVPKDLQRSNGSFNRTLSAGPVIHLLVVPNPAAGDRMPPARIADLRLEADETGTKLVAHWTAPGDDFDTGSTSGYEFLFSDHVEDLIFAGRQPPILHTSNQKDVAGTKATYSFTFTKYDRDYHVAMVAIDNKGNRGNVSNIVLVRFPQPPPTGTTTTMRPGGDPETDWLMIGVVSGTVLTLLVLILVCLYIYFFVIRRRAIKKSSGVNATLTHTSGSGAASSGGAASDNSSFDEAKNSSSNHLVPQISTISNAYKAAVSKVNYS